jgi:hypothetical protein
MLFSFNLCITVDKCLLCDQLCIRNHGDVFVSGYSEHVTIYTAMEILDYED